MNYKFEEKWPLGTGIDWWDECRCELNRIIDIYNQWQIDGFPEDRKQRVLANITYGIQTIGSRDGGDGYRETLEQMQEFVSNVVPIRV